MTVIEAFSFRWSYCLASASCERWIPKLAVGWASLCGSHTCPCMVVVSNPPGAVVPSFPGWADSSWLLELGLGVSFAEATAVCLWHV